MLERKLYIGIPKGSLNSQSPNKGWTQLLLRHAGWELEGYDPQSEKVQPQILGGDREVSFLCLRPRSLQRLIPNGGLDLVLCGEDIVKEFCAKRLYTNLANNINKIEEFIINNKIQNPPPDSFFLEGINTRTKEIDRFFYRLKISIEDYQPILSQYRKFIDDRVNSLLPPKVNSKEGYKICPRDTSIIKLCDLGFGRVNLGFAASKEDRKQIDIKDIALNFATVYTEYPYTAFWELSKYIHPRKVRLEGDEEDVIGGVTIIDLKGGEVFGSISKKSVIFETTSSGRHFKDHNLVPIGDPIMASSVGIYCKGPRPLTTSELELQRRVEERVQEIRRDLKERGVLKKADEAPSSDSSINDKIKEICERLQKAAREYGEKGDIFYDPNNKEMAIRKDSIYCPERWIK